MKTVIACLAAGWLAAVQPDASPRPARPPDAPTLDTLVFLAGAWAGELDGGHVEEHWTAPQGGNITGMFRWVNADGSVALLELLTIAKEDRGLVLRLRHFDDKLTPWKSETAPTTATLAECSATRATFRGEPGKALGGVTYERAGDGLRITVSFADGREPLQFALRRQ